MRCTKVANNDEKRQESARKRPVADCTTDLPELGTHCQRQPDVVGELERHVLRLQSSARHNWKGLPHRSRAHLTRTFGRCAHHLEQLEVDGPRGVEIACGSFERWLVCVESALS